MNDNDVSDALTTALRSAPELNSAPGLALGVAQDAATNGSDPSQGGQAVAQTINSNAQQQAVQNAAKAHGGGGLLSSTLGWVNDHSFGIPGKIAGAVATAAHDINSATGGAAGAAVNEMSAPLREVQHQYRYLHDVEATHGPLAATLAAVPAILGAVGGAYVTGSAQGAELGAEGGEWLGSHLIYRDSYDRTTSGAAYKDPNTGQPVSMGRDIASAVGLKPGSKAFTLTSGLTDAVGDLALDPVGDVGKLVGQAGSAEGAGGVLANRFGGMAPQGTSLVQKAEDVDRIYNQYGNFRRAVGQIADMTPGEISTNYPKIVGIAGERTAGQDALLSRLGAASTPDAVVNVFRDAVKAQEMVSDVMPSMTLTRLPFHAASQAIQNFEGPESGIGHALATPVTKVIKSVTSYMPTNFDAEALELSNREIDPADDFGINAVYRVARFTQSKATAEAVASEYANTTDVGKRILIYRNLMKNTLIGMGHAEDSPYVDHELQQMLGGSAPGHDAMYGMGVDGNNVSKLAATTDDPEVAAGILASQTGKLKLPNFNDLVLDSRKLSGYKSLYGRGDDFLYRNFTMGVFKKLALLSGGFAQRIAAAEAIPAAAREGVWNLVKSAVGANAARYGYDAVDGEELGHIAATVQHLKDGLGRVADVADTTINSDETTQRLADLVQANNGHIVPAAVSTETHYSGEVGGPAVKAERDVKALVGSVPPKKMFGDRFGAFGPGDQNFGNYWQSALAETARDPASQKSAEAYLEAMKARVTETVPISADQIPAAEMYHGTSQPFKNGELEHRYFAGAGANNMFGPGVYVTDDPGVALSYTDKGVPRPLNDYQLQRWEDDQRMRERLGLPRVEPPTVAKTVYGINPTKKLNVIDLEKPLPADAKAIFQSHVDQMLSGEDFTQETDQRIHDLLNSDAPGSQVYQAIRQAWSEVGLPKYEVDENLNVLHDDLAAAGYDGFRYQGGAYAGKGQGPMHNAYVIFDPQSVQIAHATPATSTVTRGMTSQEATRAASQAAAEYWRSQPARVLSNYARSVRPSVAGAEPIDDWGRVIAENMRGVTHSGQITDAAGNVIREAIPNVELVNNVATGTLTPMATLDGIDESARPLAVKGREMIDIPHGNLLDRVANFGFSRVLDPIINKLSREPIYANEYLRQFDHLAPLVDSGEMGKAEAIQLAQVRAVHGVVPFIHNTMERSQFAELARNFMPFYFAQEQAFRRFGRVLADDPGAFRQLQMMTSALTDVGHQQTDGQGKQWLLFPGAGFLDSAVVGTLGNLGIPVAGSVPVSFSGQVRSLSTILPAADASPKMGPLVAVAGHLLENFDPAARPLVTSAIGDVANSGSIWDQLIPNSTLKRTVQAFWGEHGRSFQSSMIQTIQSLQYQQNQAMEKWTAAGHSPDDPGAPNLVPSPSDTLNWQHFIDRVKNQTRINFLMKAAIGAVTPASPDMTLGDAGLRQEVQDEISKAGSVSAGIQAFLAKNPDATPYTVFQSDSPVGSGPEASKPAEDFINQNLDTIKKYPYAGAWLIPQVQGAKFDATVYNEQLAQGLRQKKTPEQFMKDLYIAAGNNQFYGADLPAHRAALAKASGSPAAVTAVQRLVQNPQDHQAAVALNQALRDVGSNDATAAENQNFTAYLNSFGQQNPVWWDDFTSSTRTHDRQLAVTQLQKMQKDGNLVGPQAPGIAHLLSDFGNYQQSLLAGQQDGWAQTTRTELKADWQSYIDGFSAAHPEYAAVARKVFRDL